MSTLLDYKCPACGGALAFDSGLQKMKCPYCDTEIEVASLQELDELLQSEPPENLTWETQTETVWNEEEENVLFYSCDSCGGQIMADKNTGATHCPYCDNPVVMANRFSGELKPDYVIPFKLDKKAAKEGLKRHIKGKFLLPKVFKDEKHIDEIKAVYVPFWLFDADAQASIQYKGVRVRHWSDNDYDYTESRYYSVYRRGELSFSNVPVDGSSKMDDSLMESLEPYYFSEAVDFQTAYLAGYLADRYDVSAEDSAVRANERIKRSTEEVFRNTVNGYDTVTTQSSSINLSNSKEKYALLPVWILNTTWRGNKYVFAMNGQTGKFVGNLPVDKKAYWRWWAILTAALAAVGYGLTWLICLM